MSLVQNDEHSLWKYVETLKCRNCSKLFTPPIAVCAQGHSSCFICRQRGSCGVCFSHFTSLRNQTVEEQISLLFHTQSRKQGKKIDIELRNTNQLTVNNIFTPPTPEQLIESVERRSVQCNLPLVSFNTGNLEEEGVGLRSSVECVAQVEINKYIAHLLQIHNSKPYRLTVPTGHYDFTYSVNSAHLFGHAIGIPIPLLVEKNQFLLHSKIEHAQFYIWISGLMSEAEAGKYLAKFQLVNLNSSNAFEEGPEWVIGVHNVNTSEIYFNEPVRDRVLIPTSKIVSFLKVETLQPDTNFNWTIICSIIKKTEVKPPSNQQPIEIVID